MILRNRKLSALDNRILSSEIRSNSGCGAYTTRWALVSGSNDLEDVLPRLCCSDTLHLEKETDPSCFHLYLNYPRMQSGPEHLKAKPHGETEVVIQRSSEQLRNVSTSPFPGQCKRLH